ncbi:MAG: ATP-binding protein [Meiothermus sp.]|nr:ATP-binding protein [Meiothermus sp.]
MAGYLPWTDEELEKLLQEWVTSSLEGPKFDVKLQLNYTTKQEKVEFCKDISSIANTDHPDHFGDFGVIVFGATRGSIVGISNMPKPDVEKLQTELESKVKEYLQPYPHFHVKIFGDNNNWWGAILIEPSHQQPHMFIRDFNGSPAKGEWFVHVGSSSGPASPEDYARILRKAVQTAVDPLVDRLSRLSFEIETLKQRQEDGVFRLIQGLSNRVLGANSQPLEAENLALTIASDAGLDLPTRVRQRYRRPVDLLATDIVQSAISLREQIETADAKILPWSLQPSDGATAKAVIHFLESACKSFVGTVASIAAYDEGGELFTALKRAISIVGRDYEPRGTFTSIGETVRQYPLVLAVYAAFVVGGLYNRPRLLRTVLDTPFRPRRHSVKSKTANIFWGLWELRESSELFQHIHTQRLHEPIGARIFDVLVRKDGWIVEYVNNGEVSPEQSFWLGEFLLSLGAAEFNEFGNRQVYPGVYFYYPDAKDVLTTFLSEPPEWFPTLYRLQIDEVLRLYDTEASLVSHRSFGSSQVAALSLFKEGQKK